MPTRTIQAIFYTRFHHEKGSRVLHQVPAGSIIPSTLPSARSTPLFPFASVAQYLIPPQPFCDRLFTFCANRHRVIGYPVCIREGGRYSRNEFIFNFAVVIGESERDWACYGEVVRKLGRLLRGLEEQGGFLSREEAGVWEDDNAATVPGLDDEGEGEGEGEGGSKVYALCEMVLEDLNNYAECMIPIDDSNTINLKLFPTRPPPPPILAHQVPLLTVSLSSLQTPISSDLTLNRILAYINGVHSISRIAQLADTDLSLTRRAIQHLVYYGCLVLLDIFSFGAIYAPTAEIGGFVVDAHVKDECLRYVRTPSWMTGSHAETRRTECEADGSQDEGSSFSSSASHLSEPGGPSHQAPTTHHGHPSTPQGKDNGNNHHHHHQEARHIDHETLISLYTSLRQGLTLKNWVLENLHQLQGIDVRRLITFGIIKGFLYRVHKYAIAAPSLVSPAPPPTSLQTSAAPSIVDPQASDTVTIRGGTTMTTQHHPFVQVQRPSITSTISVNPHVGHHPPTHHHHHHHHHISLLPKPDGGAGGGVVAGGSLASDHRGEETIGLPLLRFLDGVHCFDEICSELGLPEKVVEAKVRGMGEGVGVIVHR